MKLVLPFSFLLIALGIFFIVVTPAFNDVKELKSNNLVYNEALNNSKELKSIQDSLINKYKDISKENIDRLEHFFPTKIKDIDLVLEIEKIANDRGIIVKDVVFDTNQKDKVEENKNTTNTKNTNIASSTTKEESSYQSFKVNFTVDTTYDNFILFLKDLEYNLRLMNIKSISFSIPEKSDKLSNTNGSGPINLNSNVYSYKLTIETYWFK